MDSMMREALKNARDQIESFGLHFMSLKIIGEYDRSLRCMADIDAILTAEPEPCITIERETDKEIIVNGDPNHHIKKGSFSNKVVDVKSNSSPINEIIYDFKYLEDTVENLICNIFETLDSDYQGFEPNKILKHAMLSYASLVSDKRADELRNAIDEWGCKHDHPSILSEIDQALAVTEPKP